MKPFQTQKVKSDRLPNNGAKRAFFWQRYSLLYLLLALLFPAALNAQISGTVYRDFNANGTKELLEPGAGGITVTAYDGSNAVVNATTTAPDGTYSLAVSAGQSVRIEVTGLPSYLKPGAAGPGSATTTTFATAPASNVNVAVNNPGQYHQSNPLIAVPCYLNGSGVGSSDPGFVSFNYNASGTPTQYGGSGQNPIMDAQVQQVGSVWGEAYQRAPRRMFTAAFLKRHVGFGPRGEDGVYVLDYSTSPATVVGEFDLQGVVPANGGPTIDLGTVTRSGGSDFTLPASPIIASIDLDAFGKVGKISYGDIDMAEDGNTLWLVNLKQRALISVDVSGSTGSLPGTVRQYLLSSLPGLPSCDEGVFRPWGLKFHDGLGYLGGICSAEISQSPSDLFAYVLSFDPANPSAGFTTELSFPLNFNREDVGFIPSLSRPANWQAWAANWAQTGLPTSGLTNNFYPQPILSDIEFTESGAMVLGFIDRWGHQTGFANLPAFSGATDLFNGESAGDVIHACNINGTFVLEGQGGCPDNDVVGQAGAEFDDGPSNTGEFYYQDWYDNNIPGNSVHHEITTGGLASLPGTGEVVSTAFDPISFNTVLDGEGVFTQGLNWYNTSNGIRTDGYVVVNFPAGVLLFGKASGLGDLELVCDPAPIEIGNYVWSDDDADGIQDPNEAGIAGVKVFLKDGIGNQVVTTTDANGQYLFKSNVTSVLQPNTDYIVCIKLSDPNLGGKRVTQNDYNANAGNSDLHDSDAMRIDSEAQIVLKTGNAGENNHTYDFGFNPCPCPATYLYIISDEAKQQLTRIRLDVNPNQKTVIVNKIIYGGPALPNGQLIPGFTIGKPIGKNTEAMAYDVNGKVAYIISNSSKLSASALLKLDLTTGIAYSIGLTRTIANKKIKPISALAFNNQTNELYGLTPTGNRLLKINTTNAQVTVYSQPITILKKVDLEGASFDYSSGTPVLYAIAQHKDGRIFTIDLTTGVGTLIGAAPVSIESIEFSPKCDGLYGIGTSFYGILYSLDRTTFAPTIVSVNPPLDGEGMAIVECSDVLPKISHHDVDDMTEDEDEAETAAPTGFALHQNYPNPFNPSTRISFALPEAGTVTVNIFNETGQLVRTLADREMPAGRHELRWNGVDQSGHIVAAGVYLYRIVVTGKTGEAVFTETKRMTFLK